MLIGTGRRRVRVLSGIGSVAVLALSATVAMAEGVLDGEPANKVQIERQEQAFQARQDALPHAPKIKDITSGGSELTICGGAGPGGSGTFGGSQIDLWQPGMVLKGAAAIGFQPTSAATVMIDHTNAFGVFGGYELSAPQNGAMVVNIANLCGPRSMSTFKPITILPGVGDITLTDIDIQGVIFTTKSGRTGAINAATNIVTLNPVGSPAAAPVLMWPWVQKPGL